MLFAGWEVRMAKNCDRGLENVARGCCAIFPFCGGGKKKDKKTKAFYDWATTDIPVIIRVTRDRT